MSDVQLRPALPKDAPAISAIEEAGFENPGEIFNLRYVSLLLRNPRVTAIVAEREGTVLGWAAGFGSINRSRPWGRVHAVAVDPQARGMKLGRRLTEALIARLRERGATRIFLEVRSDNAPAVRLYEKLGFTPCKELPHFYGDKVHAQRMVREISANGM